MNRRNFLAFIPAISSIPLIGKNIEQTESGIFIAKPESIAVHKTWSIPAHVDPMKLEVKLFNKDKQVGEAYITEFQIWNERIETTCRDDMGSLTTNGLQRANFSCELMYWL